MNQTAKNGLECIRTPEPEIRLRKGLQLDGTRRGDNDNHQGDLEPVLEASVLSTHLKKTSGPVYEFVHLERNCGLRDCGGHRGGSQPILRAPTQPPVSWQPCFCRHHSHALMALAPLAPADGTERLGLAPAVSVSGSCAPIPPQQQGEVEKPSGHQGQQLPLTPADGAEQSGLTPGARKRV
ncbi:Adiponectin receptor protein 2 [Myotis davidii]|uniref:Adiponectin receptor protein 2 n=1 Tax=Myotis davidii TaxID=225400 RepID=L5MJ68_MYODS|nr:Adiponectin receptor protein 2 [Myotis davidii]